MGVELRLLQMIIIDVGSADKHPAKMQPSGNASP